MTRTEALIAELQSALSEADEMGFECPSQKAKDVADHLLRQLAVTLSEERLIDVAVGEDGGIEITASSDASLATIDVSPSGATTRLVLRDLHSGTVSPVQSGLSNAEVARRVEQAA